MARPSFSSASYSIDLIEESRRPFFDVAPDIVGALVYLDDGAGELAHFNLGLPFLYGMGVRGICSLEDACIEDAAMSCNAAAQGAPEALAIFTTRLLSDSHRHILRALRVHRSVKRCSIFCAISEQAHSAYTDTPLGTDAYREYVELLQQDLDSSLGMEVDIRGLNRDRDPTGRIDRLGESDDVAAEEGGVQAGLARNEELGGGGWERRAAGSAEEASGFLTSDSSSLGSGAPGYRGMMGDGDNNQDGDGDDDDEDGRGGARRGSGDNTNAFVVDIRVQFFPNLFCALTPRVFVFPATGAMGEAAMSGVAGAGVGDHGSHCLSPALPAIDVGLPIDIDENLPPGVSLVAHGLSDMMNLLDLKPEIFCLGPTAHAVARVISGLQPRLDQLGNSRRQAAVILVDRTLDLISPCCHGDNLVDRMLACLPRRSARPPPARPPPSAAGQWAGRHVARKSVSSSAGVVARAPADIRARMGAEVFPLFELLPEPREQRTVLGGGGGGAAAARPGGAGTAAASASGDGGEAGRRRESAAPAPPPPSPGSQDLFLLLQERHSLLQEASAEKDTRLGQKFSSRRNSKILGGAIFQPGDRESLERVEALFLSKTKDVALAIRKLLMDTVKQEKLQVAPQAKPKLGTVSPAEIRACISAFASNPAVAYRHQGLLQLAAAVAAALEPAVVQRWEALLSSEKILFLSAGDRMETIVLQLRELVLSCRRSPGSKKGGPLPGGSMMMNLRDAMTLLIVGYGLIGDITSGGGGAGSGGLVGSVLGLEEEYALKEAVIDAILAGPPEAPLGFLRGLEEGLEAEWWRKSMRGSSKIRVSEGLAEDADKEEEKYRLQQLRLELRDRVDDVFRQLNLLATARKRLKNLRYLQELDKTTGAIVHVPLVRELLTKIYSRVDIPELEQSTSIMGRLFSLGRFGLQSRPKPSDYRTAILFVIGGITANEVKEAREAMQQVSGADGVELFIGGTTLLSSDDMYDQLLGSCAKY
ncbi:hypothetical protein CBR_g35046 [Chara braunii]|uniref:Uncharacterized protein n=1 Tax=Chara braunii TaxID=69332 RepID=A0A388LK92_CHABU|nr:hypothetical protein CBR_g35046 [Chara braunii]|eukprot:GBG82681.1 hypothetical protein CBR_g35046 [Chara braunii]